MGFGIDVHDEVVERLDDRVLAGGQLVERRVFDRVAALAHAAVDSDRVAHDTAQSNLRFGFVDQFANRRIHHARKQEGGVVAAAAPLGRLGPNDILHVFDALAVPLIVERRKMMRRREPLFIGVLVASLAFFGFREEVDRDESLGICPGRTGKERPSGSIAFAQHTCGREFGIRDSESFPAFP